MSYSHSDNKQKGKSKEKENVTPTHKGQLPTMKKKRVYATNNKINSLFFLSFYLSHIKLC